MAAVETFYDVIRRQGITRRSFTKFCSLTAASLGLGAGRRRHDGARAGDQAAHVPVIWMHGLECTCCSESFIRSAHPLAKDVILSMISLDYDDTIMAAAGHQAEAILEETREKYKGKYVLAVEGNPPLNEDGMYLHRRRPAVRREAEGDGRGRAWRSSPGAPAPPGAACRRPSPTRRRRRRSTRSLLDKPIIKVPGCPPIAEVMTGVVTFITTFGRLPELDRQGRPKMFYSQRIHDKCYRRPHFDAGQFVEPGTTRARARAIASTRWAARARPPTTPAPPCAGTTASPSRSSPATAASAARKTASGIRARSTTG